MIGFPLTINEKAARVVAGVVALTALVALVTGAHWLVLPLGYGFWARVLTGPKLSPLGRLASKVELILLRDRPEMIDCATDVEIRLGPTATRLAKSTILDVPRRDALGFERIGDRRHVLRRGVSRFEAAAVH